MGKDGVVAVDLAAVAAVAVAPVVVVEDVVSGHWRHVCLGESLLLQKSVSQM